MTGLAGVRVLELGNMVSAAYASKLYADLGADVLKLEAPQGDDARRRGPFPGGAADSEQSGLYLFLNANKRSVTVDLSREAGRQTLARMARWADIVLHNYSPSEMPERGLDYERLREINPALVMCSITPFGLSGPHKDYKAYELNLAHGGGLAWLSPGASARADLPPLKAFGHQACYQAGIVGALTSLAAYWRALRSGEGTHIDVSVQEVIASMLEQAIVRQTYLGQIASRLGRRHIYPWDIFACKDGQVLIFINEQDQWLRFVDLMGNPEWASWEVFEDAYKRGEQWDVIRRLLEGWFGEWEVDAVYRAAQARRICIVPVYHLSDLPEDTHLAARHFFVGVDHPRVGRLQYPGPPYRFADGSWSLRRAAPLLGEHNHELPALMEEPTLRVRRAEAAARGDSRPLTGIRVLEFGWAWAGPYSTMMLSHLGAEVIKIESATRLDVTRRIPIYPKGVQPGVNRGAVFNEWNLGKKSLLLNLQTPEARDIALELAARSDVVLDNFASGVMDRLGLGHEALLARNPRLVAASISGFGHSGPAKDYIAYGAAIVPLSGLASLTGYAGDLPSEVGISYGDPNGGFHAAAGICAALVARELTGRGQSLDVSLWEALIPTVAEGWMDFAMNGSQPPRMGNHDTLMSPHNCYRCAGDDEWVTIACGTELEWSALCVAMAQPQLTSDPRFCSAKDRKAHESELDAVVEEWTRGRTKRDVTTALQSTGVAAFPSMNNYDLVHDEHIRSRGLFVEVNHPETGRLLHTGVPWTMGQDRTPLSPAPLLGGATEYVLRDILGYDDDRIERLRHQQILA